MYTHIMVGSNDIARSKTFYDALFTALGGKPGMQDPKVERVMYLHNGAVFIVTRPIDGQPATHANGGTAIEGPVGERQTGLGNAYLGYLRDPDGNKLCIACPAAKA